MTLKENDLVAVGTQVKALTNKSHDLVEAGVSVGIVYNYLESLGMYTIKYSVMDRRTTVPTAKIVKAHEYRHEFEVLDK